LSAPASQLSLESDDGIIEGLRVRIALIAAPFISVPPADYGGTELFVAHLAEGLRKSNIDAIVYANGESTVQTERRWMYEHSQWPIRNAEHAWIKELDHTAWATADAVKECDLIHVQSPQALAFSRFVQLPFVLTLHGPHDPKLSQYYSHYADVQYVAISKDQADQESLPRLRTIHHGIDLNLYRVVEKEAAVSQFHRKDRSDQGHTHCHRGRAAHRNSAEDCWRSAAVIPRVL
jgi:Glycosyltransferase Family 4